MKIVKSVCRLCKADCGILVHVDARGRAVKVEGDPESLPNRGALCSKGNALLQLVYDPDRVTRPLRRRRDGGWEEVSWPQALDEIAARLSAIRERYGGTALATYEGSSFTRANTQAYVRRFLHYFGSPNRTGTESLCVTPKYVAAEATLGRGLLPVGDFRRAKAIFLFGANPAFTSMHRYLRIMDDILAAREQGAALVVVDPVFTATAAKADLWVPIKPGTDLALILAMIRVIVEEGLYDAEYVRRHTSGFDSLRAAVGRYTPEWAERLTTVPAGRIGELARLYGACRPAVVDRREGCMHNTQATQTNRALLILAALGGNIDCPGGLVFNPTPPLNQGVLARDRLPQEARFFARPKFPWGDEAGLLPEVILSEKPYPIKALLVTAGNPVMAWPNTKKVIAALKKLELLVVTDLYETETAQLAHFLLPGTTCLERTDLSLSSLRPFPLIRLAQRAIAPVGEAWPEWRIFNELGRRLCGEDFPFPSEEAFLDALLQGSGYTYAELAENPGGLLYGDLPVGRYLSGGFPTPSGKIEIYSPVLEKAGFDPLPRYKEERETGSAAEYPYALVAGARLPVFSHSTLMNLPWLNALSSGHWAEISEEIAREKGLQEGDLVRITTPRGAVALPVKILPAAWPGLVLVRHGFGHTGGGRLAQAISGANVNRLTDDLSLDPLAGTPAYRELSCNIEKVKAGVPGT